MVAFTVSFAATAVQTHCVLNECDVSYDDDDDDDDDDGTQDERVV